MVQMNTDTDVKQVAAPGRGLAAANALSLSAVAGLALGALTAWGQMWLPDGLGPLANSAGSWSVVAFLLGMAARTARVAALTGVLTLGALLTGYVLMNELRGYPSSLGTILFWAAASLSAGPLLGIGGYWARVRRDRPAAIGIGGMSGVLIGEGVYGLLFVAQTTSWLYWAGSITAGVLLLAIGVSRLRPAAVAAFGVAVTAAVAAAFVVVYRYVAPTLMQLLSAAH